MDSGHSVLYVLRIFTLLLCKTLLSWRFIPYAQMYDVFNYLLSQSQKYLCMYDFFSTCILLLLTNIFQNTYIFFWILPFTQTHNQTHIKRNINITFLKILVLSIPRKLTLYIILARYDMTLMSSTYPLYY